MYQNTKRTPLPGSRWVYLLDFLRSDHPHIISILHDAITPGMIRAEVALNNIRNGVPTLSAAITYPDGGNRVVVCTIVRPPLYDPLQLHAEIDRLSVMDMMMTVSNQVEVIPE
jgi:hypothetical protein